MAERSSTPSRRPGRTRDRSIDERVLEAANRQLSTFGYEALSLTAVASEAGTTRQALYRRWPDKASLAADALLAAAAPGSEAHTADPFEDLVAELTDFRRGVSLPGRLSLVGTMLQDATAASARARYQARVIAPRRARIRAILDRAAGLGRIDQDADLDIAVTLGTGSWYATALAGLQPPPDWPRRTATLIWRAVGGSPVS